MRVPLALVAALFCCATVTLGQEPRRAGTQTRWTVVSPGVWSVRIGRPEAFDLLRVAGATPQAKALEALPRPATPPFPKSELRATTTDTKTSLRLPLERDEDIYGFGLDFKRVRQNSTIQTLHVDHWGGRSGRTHAPVPFYVSSRGYGVLINSARYLKVYVGTSLRRATRNPPALLDRNRDRGWQAHPPSDSIDVLVPAPGVEVLVFAGPTPLDAVRRYVLYTGGGCLPPRWGLGFTHRTPTRYTAAKVLAEVEEFRKRGFPLDFIGLEPGWHSHAYPCTFEWDRERFPEPQKFLATLLEKGVRANLWMNPYVRPGCALHKKLEPFAGSHHVWNGIVPDYEIAEARAIFAEHLDKNTVSLGVSGFKIDEVDGFDRWLWPDTATFPSKLDAEQIRQTYGLRIQRLVDQLFRQKDRRTYGLVRASNAGASRFPFVIYNDHYSHPEFITALCNSSFAGVLWTPEVRASKSGEEWLRRMQTVCFSPMAMLNAWASGTRPWSFPDVEEEVRKVMLLRMRLMPYLYSAFARYRFDGIPPVRAMPLVEGFLSVADARTRRRFLKNQFMVGDALLVAPLFAGQKKRAVLLPEGDWFDFYTGERTGGGEVVQVENPRIPVFVKDGGLIPLMPPRLHAPKAAERFPLEVRHYGRRAGRYRLYDDDGETFGYERGDMSWTALRIVRDGDSWRGVVDGERPKRIESIQFRFMTPRK